MPTLRPQDTAVLAALDNLLQALADFRAAYEAWALAPTSDVERSRALLDEAERRVETARAALDALERNMSN